MKRWWSALKSLIRSVGYRPQKSRFVRIYKVAIFRLARGQGIVLVSV